MLCIYIGCKDNDATECRMVVINKIDAIVSKGSNAEEFVWLDFWVTMHGDAAHADPQNKCKVTMTMAGIEQTVINNFGIDINCDTDQRILVEILPKTLGGFPFTDPFYFNEKEPYIEFEFNSDIKGAEPWKNGMKDTLIYYGPPTDKPSIPTLNYSPFDKNSCSSTLTITYSKPIATYSSEIILLASSNLLKDPGKGEKEVAAEEKDITNDLTPKGDSYTYTWFSDETSSKAGTYYFQIAFQQQAPLHTMSSPSYSEYKTLSGITCAAATVAIKNITTKIIKKELTNPSTVYSPKQDGAANITVSATTPNAGETISKIDVTIELTNSPTDDQKAFYTTTDFPNGILRTITLTKPTPTTSHLDTIAWDGRDKSDYKRILLAGQYNIKANVDFSSGQKKCDSKTITIAGPQFLNMTVDYSTEQDMRDGWFHEYEQLHRFDYSSANKPPFLVAPRSVPKEDSTFFEWVRKFSIVGKQIISPPGYTITNDRGAEFNEDIMTNIQTKYSIFSFIGHSGFNKDNTSILLSNTNYLFAHYKQAYCPTHVCVDTKCDGTFRSLSMDDVSLAILDGCNTFRNLGESTMADAMILQGVDCVIGTKKRVLLFVQISWYYNFYYQLTANKKTIALAAKDAYDVTIDQIRKFYNDVKKIDPSMPLDDPDPKNYDMIYHFGKEVDYGTEYNQLETFDNTFRIENNPQNPKSEQVSLLKIYPARYGACQKK
jgi:hypothetical protein